MDCPERFVNASVKEVAQIADVSEATVVRFGRNLGCEGFKDLKISLAQQLAVKQAIRDSANGRGQSNTGTYLDLICSSAVEALRNASRRIHPDDIENAAQMIASCKRVFVYGVGGSSAILAMEAHNRLFRLNIASSYYTDSYMQRMSASTLGPDDVGVFISTTGRPRSLQESAELAKYYGAKCIAIADRNSALAQHVNICLDVELSQSGVIHEQPNPMRFAQLAVIDCLAHRTAMILGEDTKKLLARVRSSVATMHGIVPQQPIGD